MSVSVKLFIAVTSQWASWRLKSLASCPFAEQIVRAHIKKITEAPRHRPLWGESTGARWIPLTKDQQCGKWFHLMTSSCAVLKNQTRSRRPFAWRHLEIKIWKLLSIDREISVMFIHNIELNRKLWVWAAITHSFLNDSIVSISCRHPCEFLYTLQKDIIVIHMIYTLLYDSYMFQQTFTGLLCFIF